MPVKTLEVNGLSQLLECVLDIHSDNDHDAPLWFRGLERSDFKLLPSILRDGKHIDAVMDREKRLITRFRQRSIAYWPDGYPQTDWEHLFAMQHFGVPTRLLDWTENLFVAAYFAFNKIHVGSTYDENPPIIWCLNPVKWNRSTPVLSEFGNAIQILTTSDDESEAYRPNSSKKRYKSPVALFGSHNSKRIVAQRGTFTVWGSDPRSMEDFADEMPVDIVKILIKGERKTLSQQLRGIGFSETMIFPELSYLANELTSVEGWR